jgi:hypothetical protein
MVSQSEKVEKIARMCHEVNRAYCEALGDHSQLEWDEAPSWQRESMIAGVRAHLKNPTLTPQQSHELWLEHKRKEGWRFGLVKDVDAKEHPCFRPYDELPRGQLLSG